MFNYVKKDEGGDLVPNIPKIVIHAVLGFIALIIVLGLLFGSWTIIGAGERGVVLRLGEVNRVLDPGFHGKLPWVETVISLDTRIQKYETKAAAYSQDIQTVDATLALNYHLQQDDVGALWKEIGADYLSRIIDPAIQESVKAATAKFTAQELIEERPKVKDEIKTQLSQRLQGRYITVDDFSIVNFQFSDDYEKAVERKQVAQQDALTAKNKLEQVKFEADQTVASAKAQAEAIRIQAEAITQQGGEDYVRLQAIKQWKGDLPTYMIPGAVLPFVGNVSK